MRFRAKINNQQQALISGVCAACERVGSTAAIYLDVDFFRISVIVPSPDSPQVYCELGADTVFSEYRIESRNDNKILFEVELEHLTRAICSGKNARQCQMKLLKRDLLPFLSFEAKALDMDIMHDIPIRVMKPSDIIYYTPPVVSPATVALSLPCSKLFKTVVDRMGKMSKLALLTAEQTGRLVFKVEHSSAVIRTYHAGLLPRDDLDMEAKAVVKADLRKLSTIMNFHSMQWDNACLYFSDNEALVLYISLSPPEAGHVTYFCPVVIMTEEETMSL